MINKRIMKNVSPNHVVYLGVFKFSNQPLFLLKSNMEFGVLGIYDEKNKTFYETNNFYSDFNLLNGNIHGQKEMNIFANMKDVNPLLANKIETRCSEQPAITVTKIMYEIGEMKKFLDLLTDKNNHLPSLMTEGERDQMVKILKSKILFLFDTAWNVLTVSS